MADQTDFTVSTGDPALADLPEILMFGDTRHRSAEQRLTPHYNPGIEICLSRSGIYRWDVEGVTTEIRPGELSVTRPWQQHSGHDNLLGPGRLMWFIVAAGSEGDDTDALPLRGILGDDAAAVFRAIADSETSYVGELPAAEAAMILIGEEMRSRRLGRAALIRSAVADALVAIARRLQDQPDGRVPTSDAMVPDRVLEVLRAVADDPASEWTAAGMSATAGIGLTSFTEWCRKATGRSPRWYVLEQRLLVARRELLETRRSITQIALDAGFSSSQHFSSAFRKLNGESPSEFRSRNPAGE